MSNYLKWKTKYAVSVGWERPATQECTESPPSFYDITAYCQVFGRGLLLLKTATHSPKMVLGPPGSDIQSRSDSEHTNKETLHLAARQSDVFSEGPSQMRYSDHKTSTGIGAKWWCDRARWEQRAAEGLIASVLLLFSHSDISHIICLYNYF